MDSSLSAMNIRSRIASVLKRGPSNEKFRDVSGAPKLPVSCLTLSHASRSDVNPTGKVTLMLNSHWGPCVSSQHSPSLYTFGRQTPSMTSRIYSSQRSVGHSPSLFIVSKRPQWTEFQLFIFHTLSWWSSPSLRFRFGNPRVFLLIGISVKHWSVSSRKTNQQTPHIWPPVRVPMTLVLQKLCHFGRWMMFLRSKSTAGGFHSLTYFLNAL